MKNATMAYTFCFMLLVVITGCCVGIDCPNYGGTVELRLLQNGTIVTGGPGSLLNPEFITYHPDGFEFLSNPVSFSNDTQSISLLLDAGHDYMLLLDEYDIDTISVTAEKVGKGSCGCQDYRITSVVYNGEILCNEVCDGTIEVEI